MEEAFSGPETPAVVKDKKKKHRAAPSETTELKGLPDRPPAAPPAPPPLYRPPASAGRLQASGDIGDVAAGFPLPGDSADGEAWTKAFTLEPSQTAALTLQPPQWGSPLVVDGGPTLWRTAAASAAASGVGAVTSQTVPGDFVQRLDRLTKQLDALTGSGGTGSTMNGTAELFLFVAIGLLLLLTIDTLLRFAVSVMSSSRRIGRQGGGRRATAALRSFFH